MAIKIVTHAIPGWEIEVEFDPVVSNVGIESLKILTANIVDEEEVGSKRREDLMDLLMESDDFFEECHTAWENEPEPEPVAGFGGHPEEKC